MRTKQYIDRSDASEVRTSCHHVVEKRCKTKNNTPKLFTDGVFPPAASWQAVYSITVLKHICPH